VKGSTRKRSDASLQDAFLQAILEHPDDDIPRLIFADWLEERGDPRGTFIRLQCQRAALTHRDPAFKELLAQESALLRHNEAEWSKPVLRLVDEVEYRRGFIEHVSVTAARFLKNANRLFRLTPIRSVKLTRLTSLIREISECPQMARVRELNLSHNPEAAGTRSLRLLVQSPHIHQLTGLRLFDCGATPLSATLLASTPALGRLAALELGRNSVGDDGATLLATSPHLANLRELSLYGNGVMGPGAIALASSPTFRLTHLDLGANTSANPGAPAIAGSASCSELRRLVLRTCSIGNAGVEAIATSPHLGRLEYLDLHSNHINDMGLQALAASTTLGRLAYLDLDRNEFKAKGAQAMLSSPNFPRMRQLALGRHGAPPK
jgi:uncharacterized protein (TIGR02996 family)